MIRSEIKGREEIRSEDLMLDVGNNEFVGKRTIGKINGVRTPTISVDRRAVCRLELGAGWSGRFLFCRGGNDGNRRSSVD